MPNYRAPLDDVLFSLRHAVPFDAHLQHISQGELQLADLNDLFSEAARFAEQVLDPLRASGDEAGVHLDADGHVITPAGFREAYRQFTENGWQGLAQPEAYGGQGLPESIWFVINEFWQAANHPWAMYIGTTEGACATLRTHASDTLKERFLPKLTSGEWPGTMCLTEAHCGSDLGLLRTKAAPNDDGSFSITGEKIFISSGDHDMAANILHLVLARLPDAPAGSAGISLFLVPRQTVNENGQAGAANGVRATRLESKMGLRANATCVMNFDAAREFLVGPANKGLSCMFTFINNSRLGVAIQGLAHIDAAHQIAAAYAEERLQGAALQTRTTVPIARHADVQRMLNTQAVIAAAGRVLLHDLAIKVDLQHATDRDVAQRANTLLALLTPIAKGCLTEWSGECTNLALQVLGGHGYMTDHDIEQHVRDARVTQIYEGTTGIQALDLLERKVIPSNGRLIELFIEDQRPLLETTTTSAVTAPMLQLLNTQIGEWRELTSELVQREQAAPGNARAAAFHYLMYSGWVVLACYVVRLALAAERTRHEQGEQEFLQRKIELAQFFFAHTFHRRHEHVHILRGH